MSIAFPKVVEATTFSTMFSDPGDCDPLDLELENAGMYDTTHPIPDQKITLRNYKIVQEKYNPYSIGRYPIEVAREINSVNGTIQIYYDNRPIYQIKSAVDQLFTKQLWPNKPNFLQ